MRSILQQCIALTAMLTVLVLTTPASAAVIVTSSASAPTTNVLLNVTGGTFANALTLGTANSNVQIGQSILMTNSVQITKVSFLISAFAGNASSAAFKMNIYTTSGVAVSPLGGTLLSATTGTFPASVTVPAYLTFTLDAPIILAAGTNYIFMLASNDPTNNHQVSFPLYTAPTTTGGSSSTWYFNGTTYVQQVGKSNLVYFQGAVVPEPGTVGMLGLGVILLMGFSHLRRRSRSSFPKAG